MRRQILRVAFALALPLSAAGSAHAESPLDAAKKAYDRGAAAYDAGDYTTAASELVRADEMVPSDVALELAVKAAVKADDAALVLRLLERAEGRTSAPSVAAAVEMARAKVAARAGRIKASCGAGTSCAVTLDDAPVPVAKPVWVLAGEHRVVFETAGQRQAFTVRVEPNALLEVVAAPLVARPSANAGKETTTPSASPESKGLSRGWFWVGLGTTALVATAALVSGLDTQSKWEEFGTRPSAALSRDGGAAQVRTNVLFVGTGVASAATAVLGIFFVDWDGSARRSAQGKAP